jgi:general secretion pathway protein N
MMNRRSWALLLFAYSIVLIVSAPASLIGPALNYASNGRIDLANAKGIIWNGTASPILIQRGGGLITLNSLHWDISALALLKFKIIAQLNWETEQQVQPMNVIASFDQVELQHTYFPLPAILLDEASDFLKPAALRGQIILRGDSLIISKQGVQGTATADWLNASSLLSSISPLGDYHFIFSSTSAGLDINLSTTSGALILKGQGRLLPNTGLEFNGTAQAAKGNEEALRELLSHLGPQLSPGISTFSLVPARTH